MARVKLLTIHWGLSYGAIMQTYATCKILKKHGHNVSVINLVHPKLRRFYFKLRSYLLLITDLQFALFKHMYFPNLTSKKYYINKKSFRKADYIIIGSDQVWNRDLTRPIDLSFFVDCDDEIPKIALASSFGKSSWDENESYTGRVRLLLNKFKAISVREDSGCMILEDVFNLKSTVLIDPTLAYGYFDDLVLNNKQRECIYTFLVQKNDINQSVLCYVSNDLKIPIFRHSRLSHYLKNSPRDWLTYIKTSKLIITDSFHGVAFSIIFKKQFMVLCSDENKFTRIKSLLDMLGLSDKYVRSIGDYKNRKDIINSLINYDYIEDILKEERRKYNEFIQMWIK